MCPLLLHSLSLSSWCNLCCSFCFRSFFLLSTYFKSQDYAENLRICITCMLTLMQWHWWYTRPVCHVTVKSSASAGVEIIRFYLFVTKVVVWCENLLFPLETFKCRQQIVDWLTSWSFANRRVHIFWNFSQSTDVTRNPCQNVNHILSSDDNWNEKPKIHPNAPLYSYSVVALEIPTTKKWCIFVHGWRATKHSNIHSNNIMLFKVKIRKWFSIKEISMQ